MVNLSQVVNWPNKVLMLPSLIHLSLSDCRLISTTTSQLLSMINANSSSQLIFLDLSWNYDLMETHNLDWLTHFSSLQYLDLSRVNLSQVVNWPNKVLMLPSLIHLSLSDCSLISTTTPQFLSINANSSSQLLFLDLSENYDLMEPHNLDWLTHFSSLQYLDLNGVNLSQVVNWPNKVLMLPSLIHLSLSDCSLISTTTPQLLSINANSSSQLLFLDLSYNYLTNSVFHWLFNATISSLRTLNLAENQLVGGIPKYFWNLCALEYLTLSYNNLNGSLYEFMSNESSCLVDSLQDFHISNNRFIGSLPESIGNLSNLQTLDVAQNSLTGVITEAHFSNLTKLKMLYLYSNSLILRFSYNWVPPFQLYSIYLSSCKLGSAFPKWLQSQKNYYQLYISDAGISDIIPAWFWNFPPRLTYLDMSNNQLHGNLPDLSSSRLDDFASIDLSANRFDGSIPLFPLNMASLDLSNNRFSGPVSFLCKLNTPMLLESLNLSNNTLSGELPDCWTYIRDLIVLNLANNNFYGKIPDSISSLESLQFLHLSNNGFVGNMPMSLQNCSELITIDLGANNLFGMVPPWIGNNLPNLVILNLRSNQLYGRLPLSLCRLSHIQILDLSLNKIEGTIPECIYNLTAMSHTMDTISSAIYADNISRGSYTDYASLVWKGRELVFKNSLRLVKMIDLSNNKLYGEIPEGITNLIELVALNLSRNNLSGLITPKIGLLRNLQSLDLSGNQLYGEIPMSISNLNFLSQLDLSANNLSGKIPTGTQIQSLDASAFLGNPKLCGSPLPNKCPEDLHPNYINTQGHKKENDDDGFITKGFYVAATLGFIVGFWGVCCISVLNIRYIMKRLISNVRMILA
ncbi:receptor-like protein EIX2 isoform X2 [Juglans regia]|uniref:Receptor-like protein EIX2 isoform X2 n=1 Tax=Juglans regia TaxID=51240 RepID=A0A2I4F941_JUGRE|nr:receptor-like protein EIX2 isoform X2 [Juglans regia]